MSEQNPVFERSVQSIYLDGEGREIPNPVPMSPPVGYVKRESIADQIRAAIRAASLEAAQAGAETEEEANDFDVGEDFDPESPYEHDFDIDPAAEAMLALASRPPIPQPDAPPPSKPAQKKQTKPVPEEDGGA